MYGLGDMKRERRIKLKMMNFTIVLMHVIASRSKNTSLVASTCELEVTYGFIAIEIGGMNLGVKII